ncbi:JM6 [macacine gammaherpesvirus 11]|uniref:JM6 n=2 Tax=macacine gammaherpesvirus 11 TaxID=2560570 RepID=G9JMI4_9GAMA|nr:JM6 [Macaca fuscata rhadinovirus]AAS99983.1 JM6 [Macaca fuscata rhadinovirus]AEW87531.1 JM6 [Macaca fuscata rhadinovirus]AEW87701.1 JM6 [Macaca fuscata rhadinovirus]
MVLHELFFCGVDDRRHVFESQGLGDTGKKGVVEVRANVFMVKPRHPMPVRCEQVFVVQRHFERLTPGDLHLLGLKHCGNETAPPQSLLKPFRHDNAKEHLILVR